MTLTTELNALIREAFIERGISYEDDFINYNLFSQLQEGDLVCFPHNLRSGIYKVIQSAPPAWMAEEKGLKAVPSLYRNCCSVPLLKSSYNEGVWLLRLNKELINWEEWEDVEELISVNLTNHALNWKDEYGYSDWYDWSDWQRMFPPESLPEEIQKVINKAQLA